MPIIINQPNPSPSPTPIPTKSALGVAASNILQYNADLVEDNPDSESETVTFQNMLDNNAAMAAILRAYSNES